MEEEQRVDQEEYSAENWQNGDSVNQYRQPGYSEPGKQSNMALASLILGILGIVTSCCCYGGLIFGSLGITFALLSKRGDTMEGYAKAGLITSIVALSMAALALVTIFGMMVSSILTGGVY